MPEIRILATCALGLGFSYKGFQAGLEREPHLVACDAGSSDYGPFYLGSGRLQKQPEALERELLTLLEGARRVDAPFITGSVGGAGDDPHVEQMAAFVRELAFRHGMRFRMAEISAHVSEDFLRRKIKRGEIAPAGPGEDLTEAAVKRLSAAVAQMGAEPFLRALDQGADLILAGRATDPAIFAGVPLRAGLAAGPSWHAAKCIDKGYLATTRPQDGSPVLARIRDDGFTVEPTRDNARCTVATVSGMVVYENHDPFLIAQPEGTIDTCDAVYTQIDERMVGVTGSRFLPADHLTVKIEGASRAGYRAVLMAGIRDPRLIARLDEFLDSYRAIMARVASSLGISQDEYKLQFRVYGRDAVMGEYEPQRDDRPHEIGLLVDLVGKSADVTAKLSSRLAPTGSRLGMEEGVVGGGNFAFPFSPAVVSMGPVYEWSVWHIARLSDMEMAGLFPVTISNIGARP